MGGIDVRRWLLSGAVAGVFLWLLETVAGVFYYEEMQASLEAHELSLVGMDMWAVSLTLSLLAGLALVFFYAAARPRFGPGPATALKVALVFWMGAYVIPIAGLWMIGLHSTVMLIAWAGVALVEVVVAGLIGGMLYQERSA